jgi:hypothetical protein
MPDAADEPHLRHADEKKSDSIESDSFRTNSQIAHGKANVRSLRLTEG